METKALYEKVSKSLQLLNNARPDFKGDINVSFELANSIDYAMFQFSPFRTSKNRIISFIACKLLKYRKDLQDMFMFYLRANQGQSIIIPSIVVKDYYRILRGVKVFQTYLSTCSENDVETSFACIKMCQNTNIIYIHPDTAEYFDFPYTWGHTEIIIPIHKGQNTVNVMCMNRSFTCPIEIKQSVWNEYVLTLNDGVPKISLKYHVAVIAEDVIS